MFFNDTIKGEKELQQTKLVIFDMDGLLFDTEKIAYQAFEQTLANYGYTYTKDIFKQMVGGSKVDDEKILQEAFGSHFRMQMIEDEYENTFQKLLQSEGLQIKHGALKLLDALDERGIKRCIASSSPLETIEKYLKMANLTNRFNFFMSGEEVEHGKPYPDIFLEACKRAQVEKENAMVLEDSYNGFLAAYRAGIKCIIVPDLVEPNSEMKTYAYRIIEHLGDVIPLIS